LNNSLLERYSLFTTSVKTYTCGFAHQILIKVSFIEILIEQVKEQWNLLKLKVHLKKMRLKNMLLKKSAPKDTSSEERSSEATSPEA